MSSDKVRRARDLLQALPREERGNVIAVIGNPRKVRQQEDAAIRAEIEALLVPSSKPSKSYTELIKEGVPHKGGLARLAEAERAGVLFG